MANPVTTLARTISKAWAAGESKALSYPTSSGWYLPMGARLHELERKVGDGLHNSIVVGSLLTYANAFGEPSLLGYQPDSDNPERQVPTSPLHPAAALWESPNDYQDSDFLAWYLTVARKIHGNAFLWKQRALDFSGRGGSGKPIELWPIPPDRMKPKTIDDDPKRYLDYWEYDPGNGRQPQRFPSADIIHLRAGHDPDDFRLGFSPFRALLREVFTDDEAARYTATILRNMAVPSIIASPGDMLPNHPDTGSPIDMAKAIKQSLEEDFSGDNRGRVMVPTGPFKISKLNWSPSELDLKTLRRIPEERISSSLQVPAILANLGAGLDMSSGKSEVESLRKFWTQSVLVPDWRGVGRQVTRQLMTEWEPRAEAGRSLRFNMEDVQALKEDANAVSKRKVEEFRGGLITRADGKVGIGMEPKPGDDVYLVPAGLTLLPEGEPTEGEPPADE